MIDTVFVAALIGLVVLGLAALVISHPVSGRAAVLVLFGLMLGAHWREQISKGARP